MTTLREHFNAYKGIAKDDLQKEQEHDKWRRCVYFVGFMRDVKGMVLDVGCGRAVLDYYINQKFKVKPVGVDLSVDYLKVAKPALENSVCAVIESLPFPDNLFDVVICDSVLEHVLDVSSSTKELYRVLKVEGKLYVQVPYRENFTKYPFTHGVRQHIRSFDENLLHKLFNFSRLKKSRAESICVSTIILPLDKREAGTRVGKNLVKLRMVLAQSLTTLGDLIRSVIGNRIFFLVYDKVTLTFHLCKPVFVMIESVKRNDLRS